MAKQEALLANACGGQERALHRLRGSKGKPPVLARTYQEVEGQARRLRQAGDHRRVPSPTRGSGGARGDVALGRGRVDPHAGREEAAPDRRLEQPRVERRRARLPRAPRAVPGALCECPDADRPLAKRAPRWREAGQEHPVGIFRVSGLPGARRRRSWPGGQDDQGAAGRLRQGPSCGPADREPARPMGSARSPTTTTTVPACVGSWSRPPTRWPVPRRTSERQ